MGAPRHLQLNAQIPLKINSSLNFFFAACSGGENCGEERELPSEKHSWNPTALTKIVQQLQGKHNLASPPLLVTPSKSQTWVRTDLETESSEQTQLEGELCTFWIFFSPKQRQSGKWKAQKHHLQSRVFKKQQELKTFGVDDGCPSSAALKAAVEQKQGRKLRWGQSSVLDHPEPHRHKSELWGEEWERKGQQWAPPDHSRHWELNGRSVCADINRVSSFELKVLDGVLA